MATSQPSSIPLNPKKEVSYITKTIHESSIKNSPSLNDMTSTSTVPEGHSNTSSNKELSELSTVSPTSHTHIKEIKNDLEFSPYYLKMNTIHEIRNPPELVDSKFRCSVCCSFLKDSGSVHQHVKSGGHITRLEEHYIARLLPHFPPPSQHQVDAMSELVTNTWLQNHSSSIKGQNVARKNIAKELDKLVKQVDKDIIVELFGSTMSGVTLYDSDVNINLNIGDIETNQKRIPGILLKVLQLLRKSSDYVDVRNDFYSPLKVPRILFVHKSSNLLCELRAGSIAPVQLSSLLGIYCQMDDRVLVLCTAFRYWAKFLLLDHQMDGHYPAVTFILFVIHYLQHTTPPVLPVLHEMVPMSKTTEDDREIEFDMSLLVTAAQKWQTTNEQSLGELLYGLLKYYVLDFNLFKHAVSIRQFEPLLRKDRGWGSNRLAVEDPIIPKSNIARAAGSDKIFEYLTSCLKHTFLHVLQVTQKIRELIVKTPNEDQITPSFLSLIQHEDKQQQMNKENVDTSQNQEDSDIHEDKLDEQVFDTEDDVTMTTDTTVESINESTEDVCSSEDLAKSIDSVDSVKPISEKRASKRKKSNDITFLCQLLACVQVKEETPLNSWIESTTLVTLRKIYPTACILCKKSRHTAVKCPDENVPKLHREAPPPPVKYLKEIDDVLINYMKEVMLLPREERERAIIRDEILSDVRKLYPKATLELFGSSANGFGHCQSDLDLCLLMNETYECEKSEIIEKLAKAMRKNSSYYSHVIPILSARVPIVKMYIKKWNIEGDISLENCLALQNTKMLSTYCSLDERVRPLGYAVKSFAKACDMCDAASGSLSSYAYIIMLIHYLQQLNIPVLPVLQKLPYHGRNNTPTIDGWNCYFFQPKSREDLLRTWTPRFLNNMSISQLWLGFLRFYARDFDWAHHVVTMRQLEPLTKFEKWWSPKPVAIEDPFNLDHNLGQAVSSRMRTYILMRFQKAYYHHSKSKHWNVIEDLMDSSVLCGDFKAPKFIICDKCNRRGHRANECPKIETSKTIQLPLQSISDKIVNNEDTLDDIDSSTLVTVSDTEPEKPVEQDKPVTKETVTEILDKKQPQADSVTTTKPSSGVKATPSRNELTRSQIRAYIAEQTGESLEELRKLKQQLRAKAYSKGSTPQDRKMVSVVSDMLKKMEKEERARKTAAATAEKKAELHSDLQDDDEIISTDVSYISTKKNVTDVSKLSTDETKNIVPSTKDKELNTKRNTQPVKQTSQEPTGAHHLKTGRKPTMGSNPIPVPSRQENSYSLFPPNMSSPPFKTPLLPMPSPTHYPANMNFIRNATPPSVHPYPVQSPPSHVPYGISPGSTSTRGSFFPLPSQHIPGYVGASPPVAHGNTPPNAPPLYYLQQPGSQPRGQLLSAVSHGYSFPLPYSYGHHGNTPPQASPPQSNTSLPIGPVPINYPYWYTPVMYPGVPSSAVPLPSPTSPYFPPTSKP